MDGAGLVTQPDRAHRYRLHNAGMLFADIDDIADRDLILHQDEKTGDDILDERLAAKADRHADDPGAGEQRGDVDADMGQHDQRGQDDDHAQDRGAEQRQQRTDPGPAWHVALVDPV